MDLFATFSTDQQLENNGVWRPCGKGRVLVASATSETYRKAIKKILGPREMEFNLGTIPEAEADDLMKHVESEGMLLGWEGFTENGADLPYSTENSYRALKELPHFRGFVKRIANDIETYRVKKEDTEIKNS